MWNVHRCALSLFLSHSFCFFVRRENKCFVHCGFSYHGSCILVPCRNGRRNGSHLVACVDHRGGETRKMHRAFIQGFGQIGETARSPRGGAAETHVIIVLGSEDVF